MGANMITVTKKGKEAQIVASTFPIWEERGWSKKEDKPAPKKSTGSGSGPTQ